MGGKAKHRGVAKARTTSKPSRTSYTESPVPIPPFIVRGIQRTIPEAMHMSLDDAVTTPPKSTEKTKKKQYRVTTASETELSFPLPEVCPKKSSDSDSSVDQDEMNNTDMMQDDSKSSHGVVLLKGPENMDTWHESLLVALGPLRTFVTRKPHRIVKPGLDNQGGRERWKANRRVTRKILTRSLSGNMRKLVEAYGGAQARDRDQQDPFKQYQAVLRVLRTTADNRGITRDLVRDFCCARRADHDSIAAYQTHLEAVRRKLDILGASPSERFMVFSAIQGLEFSRRKTDKLVRALVEDSVTEGSAAVPESGSWDKLMDKLSDMAPKEPQSSVNAI